MKPSALITIMIAVGVACLVASGFVPPEFAAQVASAGTFLLGWATKRPGELSPTTHPDDLK